MNALETEIAEAERLAKKCHDCGVSIANRCGPAKYCMDCVDRRARESNNRCAERRMAGLPRRFEKGKGDYIRTPYQALAHRYVQAAIKRGELPRLDGSVPCVDCGKPACDYDHRDYLLPLEVDPVCRGCNLARGAGKHGRDRVADRPDAQKILARKGEESRGNQLP